MRASLDLSVEHSPGASTPPPPRRIRAATLEATARPASGASVAATPSAPNNVCMSGAQLRLGTRHRLQAFPFAHARRRPCVGTVERNTTVGRRFNNGCDIGCDKCDGTSGQNINCCSTKFMYASPSHSLSAHAWRRVAPFSQSVCVSRLSARSVFAATRAKAPSRAGAGRASWPCRTSLRTSTAAQSAQSSWRSRSANQLSVTKGCAPSTQTPSTAPGRKRRH